VEVDGSPENFWLREPRLGLGMSKGEPGVEEGAGQKVKKRMD